MGQRTQILVLKENNKGERKVNFYHHQWGIGRVMYLYMMQSFIADYNKDTWPKDYDFFEAHSINTNGTRLLDTTDELPEDVCNSVAPDDFESIVKAFSYGDNNNGGLFIYVKENEPNYSESEFKIGFLLGTEDEEYEYEGKTHNVGNGKAWERWLTPQEYGQLDINSDYADETFVKMFDDFCKYFNIEYFKNEEDK